MTPNHGLPRRALVALALSTALAASVPAGAQNPSNQRLIVHFHDEVPPAAANQEIRQTVGAAMARAGIATPSLRSSRQLSSGVQPIRRLGTGAQLLRLPKPLDPVQMQRLLSEIAADPAVRYVEPDRMQYAAQAPTPAPAKFQPNDEYYAEYQWNLHDPVGGVNAPEAWTMSRGAGVVVAVLDTGLLPEHPDLDPARLLQGYDFINDASKSRRAQAGPAPGALDMGDWTEADGECYAGSKVQSSSWHGAHVAATIIEATNNSIGMAGLAPDSTLLPVRVLGRCGGWISDIVDGITWASGGSVQGVPDNPNPADILNLSIQGGGACPRVYQEAIDAAVARGAVLVVAAGNNAVDASSSPPGNCRNIINVGATSASGAITSYSNFGGGVDLAAPGGEERDGEPRGYIWQAAYDGKTTPTSGDYDYIGKVGTSMATPHVSATAALVQSARVAAGRQPLAPARMKALLQASARPFPVPPPVTRPIGVGILDAAAALRMALNTDCDVAREECTPLRLLPRTPVGGQNGEQAGKRYTFFAQAGKPLRVLTYGGTGGLTLYVRRGTPPQTDRFDARSARAGTHEAAIIARPAADVYHVWLAGDAVFEGVTVVVRQ
ncbi:MAG TPA: S8 family peptidase [Stenotrophomonas sp.]|nr:S8 family peptidase [Stenotrophomonas sp.]